MSASTSASVPTRPLYPNQHQASVVTPTRQPMQRNQTKPLSSIPAHVRSEIPSLGSTSISGTSNVTPADVKGKGPAHPTGLNTPITPLHPPPRPNSKPPQYQHQSDRRVSFADHQVSTTKPPSAAATTIPEPKHSSIDFDVDDESFGFNSDDAALFALADLGPPVDPDEADAGRPIDSDEGRPIDSNEGLLGGGNVNDTMMVGDDVFDQHQHQKKTEPPVVSVVSAPKLSRQEIIAAALMSVKNKTEATSTSGPLLQGHPSGLNQTTSGTRTGASDAPDKMLLHTNTDTNASSSISGLDVGSSIPQQQQKQNQKPGLNLTSLAEQRYQRHMAQRPDQKENQNQAKLSSSTSRDVSKRVLTPSIGGFHLPHGIVCPRSLRCVADFQVIFFFFEGFITTSQLGHFHFININFRYRVKTTRRSYGVSNQHKSPISMPLMSPLRFAFFSRSNGSHTYKPSGGRPGIGMGLQQSISGPSVSTGAREVLGRLEVGEGGDVKRVRR